MQETRALLEGWVRLVLEKRPRTTTEDQVNSLVWGRNDLFAPEGCTLLEILGYVQGEVTPQETVKAGRTNWRFDFVVRKNGKQVLLVEDKKPQENLNDHMIQPADYLLKVPAPLGLLFNGREVKMLINTNLKELRQFEVMHGKWVAEAVLDDMGATVDLLLQLSAANLGTDAIGTAKRLAKKKMAEMRKEDIGARLQEIMDKPPSELLDSIIKMDAVLSDLKATPEELREVWTSKPRPSPPGDTTGLTDKVSGNIAQTIRRKIAQLCSKLGWEKTREMLNSANIRYLRIRDNGVLTGGFGRVEPWEGVPDGLCVGPVDTPRGMHIIAQLDRLLSDTPDSTTP